MKINGLEDADRKWIDARWQWLLGEFGEDILLESTTVVPEDSCFPSLREISKPKGLGTGGESHWIWRQDIAKGYLRDLRQYMRLETKQIELEFFQDENEYVVSEEMGATGYYYQDSQDSYKVALNASDLEDDKSIVATISHELAHVHLLGGRRISPEKRDHEHLTDLLTVFMGLGLFSADTAVRDVNQFLDIGVSSYTTGAGYLTLPMYGYSLALYARHRAEPEPDWSYYLRQDVKSIFFKAMDQLKGNGLAKASDVEFDDHFFEKQGTRMMLRTEHKYVPKEFSKSLDEERSEFELGSSDDQDVPESLEDSEILNCLYCEAVVMPGDEVCIECQESIEENAKELEEERQSNDHIGTFLLASIAILAAAAVIWIIGISIVNSLG